MMFGTAPSSGELVLTAEEVAGIKQLASSFAAQQVTHEGGVPLAAPSQLTLLRFLRARKHDLAAASKQLWDERRWRAANSIDELLTEQDPAEAIYKAVTPHAHYGFSKEGMPVYYERSGEVDVPHLLTLLTRKQCALRHVWHMEMMAKRMESNIYEGRAVTKQVCS
jgi:hypothetical protein